ncbi:MAG: hypothetical protein DGJ47_000098 [Rickettsiaceae bacterium]
MYWSDTRQIAHNLEENYSEEEIPENNLPYLIEMVLSLDDFSGSEAEADEDNLKRILELWIEIRGDV